jgi:two-component system OmpR family sensor kinase
MMTRKAGMSPSWTRWVRRGFGHTIVALRGARGRLRRARLRTRVLAGVLAVTLIALVGFDIAAVTALRGYLVGRTDSQLREVLSVYQHAKLARPTPGPFARGVRLGGRVPVNGAKKGTPVNWAKKQVRQPPRFVRSGAGPLGPPFPQGIALQVPILQQFGVSLVRGASVKGVSPRVSIPGRTIHNASLSLPPGDVARLRATYHADTVPGPGGHGQLRRMAAPYPGGGILVATTSLDGVDKTVSQLELILIIGSAAAGLLAAGGAAWIMRRGLRPVETMAGQADKITAGDLTERVSPHDARTEIGRLGRALNGMLGRIEDFIAEREASQQAANRFFADASHELRTPLASLRANAELYQQGALPERAQVDEAMRRITAEAQRMSGLLDDMLRLARLDQHPERHDDGIDLTELARECAERARTAYPERTWQASIDPGLTTSGDEELLRRAIDNLLANVAAHTPDDTTATLTAAQYDATIIIEVSDDGPGVPEDQLPHLFERFYRGSAPSPRPGSGLGLAVVAATAVAHHGTAQATPNHPHGLVITLTLPIPTPPQPAPDPTMNSEPTIDHLR